MQHSAAEQRRRTATPLWVVLAVMIVPAAAVASAQPATHGRAPNAGAAASGVAAARATGGPGESRFAQADSPEYPDYWRDYWQWYEGASRRYREQQRQAAQRYWWRQQRALEHWRRYGWPVPRYSPLVYGPMAPIQPRVGVGVHGPVLTFDLWR